jgi:hypothetical protein
MGYALYMGISQPTPETTMCEWRLKVYAVKTGGTRTESFSIRCKDRIDAVRLRNMYEANYGTVIERSHNWQAYQDTETGRYHVQCTDCGGVGEA